jgi:hypothetical protein
MKYNTINLDLDIHDHEIKDIVITALEGGIGYWGCLLNEGKEFDDFYKLQSYHQLSTSEFVADLLLSGKSVLLFDTELDFNKAEKWELNLTKLLNGIKLYIITNKQINLPLTDNLDSNMADSIIQYALFNELVYG